MTQVFISYKSEYRHLAERVRDQLRVWGYDTWFDHDNIPSGAYFRHEIQRGLESSDIVIGLMTQEAFSSREVLWEWDYALYNSRFIALKYDDTQLPYHLSGTQYIDFTSSEREAWAALYEALSLPQEAQPYQPRPESAPAEGGEMVRPAKLKDNNRSRMLHKVRQYWIEGVLEPSLRAGAIDLDLALAPQTVLKHHAYGDYALPKNASIATIFADLQRELLILGAPGAGKTTLMLQLAQHLVGMAERDDTQPIPVVINLSSWAARRGTLEDWLTERLNLEYQVPARVTRLWIENATLQLLLDGLDEVSETYRNACIEAINTFRRQYLFVDVVVCSRVGEYTDLTDRLDLSGALMLQPMTQAQIQAYLQSPDLLSVRELVATDALVSEMAQTPFLLNALATAYRGQSLSSLDGQLTLEERRDHLFEHYFRKRFDAGDLYTLSTTHHYLSWLAAQLAAQAQIIFYIENIQPDWLSARQRKQYRTLRWAVAGAFIVGLVIITLALGFHLRGMLLSLIVGALGALSLVRSGEVRNVEAVHWSWWGARISAGVGLLLGALTTLGALALQLVGTPAIEIPALLSVIPDQLRHIIAGTLVGMLVGAVFSALLGGLLFGNRQIEIRTRPNQGIWRSVTNAVTAGLVFGLAVGVVAVIAFKWVVGGIFVGFIAVIAVFLTFGGIAAVKHLLLRLVLRQSGDIPGNFARFLDFAARAGMMRRVGGGAMFVHRYLLDYFASLAGSISVEKES